MLQIREYAPISEVLVLIGALSLVYLLIKRFTGHSPGSDKRYPPSVGCLPVIGSLPYLPNLRILHEWSLDKSYKLGGVFSFKVGNVYSVILASHEAIREAFLRRSVDYADRPIRYSNKIFNPDDKGIVFHYYNEKFKKYHQISLSILKEFGFGRKIMETRINLEVEWLINKIHEFNGQSFDPKEIILMAVQNIISRILFGQPIDPDYKVDKRLMELMHKWPKQVMDLLILDFLPSLRYLPFMSKHLREATELTAELFSLLDKKIEEIIKEDSEESFISCYIKNEGPNFDQDQLKLTLRDFFVAGSDTLASTIQFAMILLANHQDVQQRLQQEVDEVTNKDKMPSVSDLSKMKYMEANILEIMRIKTVAPLGVMHSTLCDTEVCGYFIPANSQVFSVLHALHMDVRVWGDPAKFRPERFLDSTGNIINKDLVIPFSIGKRSCLGELMARQEIFLFLTGLVQRFNILPPEESDTVKFKDQMDSIMGPTPFKVRLIERVRS